MILQRYRFKNKKRNHSFKITTSKRLKSLRRLLNRTKYEITIWAYYAGYPSHKFLVEYMRSGNFVHKYDDLIGQILHLKKIKKGIKQELNALKLALR